MVGRRPSNPFAFIFNKSNSFTNKTLNLAMAQRSYPLPTIANPPAQTGNGFGNTHFHLRLDAKIPEVKNLFVIISMKADYKKPSNNPFEQPISKNESLATPSATLSPPTYYRAATISVPSKNSSVTKTSKPL